LAGQATRGSGRKQGYQRIVQGSTRMNRTGSGLSIHLQDEDSKDKDSAGGRRYSQDRELHGEGCCKNAVGMFRTSTGMIHQG